MCVSKARQCTRSQMGRDLLSVLRARPYLAVAVGMHGGMHEGAAFCSIYIYCTCILKDFIFFSQESGRGIAVHERKQVSEALFIYSVLFSKK